MNQRIGRNQNDKNNLDFVSIGTGGHTARHTPNEQPTVQVPQKTTGDIKPEFPKGTAKASPNFKPIEPTTKTLSKADEQKAIAENVEPIKDENNDKK